MLLTLYLVVRSDYGTEEGEYEMKGWKGYFIGFVAGIGLYILLALIWYELEIFLYGYSQASMVDTYICAFISMRIIYKTIYGE